MKRIFLTLILCVTATTINAQTIHWLTFIDTSDENVGDIDKTGRKVLYNHFVNVVNAALLEKGYKSDIIDVYDSAFSPERCKREVTNLKCSPEDIVIFYYIGHGTHARNEDNPYPQLLLGCDFSEEHKFIPLKWVHDELKTKGARLAVTIGMCCNVIQSARAKKTPTFGVNYGNVELTDTEKKAIQDMFIGYTGDILLSSASVGQSSLGGSTSLGDMDIFTAVLVTIFEDKSYEGKIEWDNLFTEVKGVIHEATNGKQTPFWESHLTPASMPSPQPVNPPVAKTVQSGNPAPTQSQSSTVNINDQSAMNNYLTSFLDCIVDARSTGENRKAQTQKIRPLFTDDAVVKFLPQDGNIVIDREDIDTFLGRISDSRIILKVAPVTYEHNGQKITELKVVECYKSKK